MFIKLQFHGILKEKLPKGKKKPHVVYAKTIHEILSYLKQYPDIHEFVRYNKFQIRVGDTLDNSRYLNAAELISLEFPEGAIVHIAPQVSGGDFITGAMLISAAISVAVGLGVSLIMSLLAPAAVTTQDDRKSKLYQGGLVTQKEGIPLNYIAGLDVLCGSNLIEGLVTHTNSGAGSSSTVLNSSWLANKQLTGQLNGTNTQNSSGFDLLNQTVSGAKGGGKTISNTVFTDATLSALVALGDGPIGGIVGATDEEKERNIYINEQPLRDHGSNEIQFQGVQWEERYGDVGQSAITITPFVANNFDASIELVAGLSNAIEVQVTDASVNRCLVRLGVNGLVKTSKKGNQSTTNISVGLDVKRQTDADWTAAVTSFNYTGKTSDPIVLERIIYAPPAKGNETWQFRLYRITPDSTDDKLQNDTSYNGYVEIQDIELSYDGSGYTHNGKTFAPSNIPTALFGINIDLAQFDAGGRMPEVALRCAGRKVRVPSNYDPIARTYTGSWDGTWKTSATQNPVWHWLHIATAQTVGLGIPDEFFDKYELYYISQYNDQNINGRPRYTLNKQFTDEQDGWPALVDLASTFRAFPFYNGTQIVLVQDRPQSVPDHYINNTMVQDGWFNYVPVELQSQFNEVLVEWDDPSDYFRKKTVQYRQEDVIAVNKAAGLSNGGVISEKYYKTGCTNEQEAYDFARALCFDALNEVETVEFTTMVGAAAYMPGQIIAVDDMHLSGKLSAGRLMEVGSTTVTLDHEFTQGAYEAYDLWCVVNNQLVIRPIATSASERTTAVVTVDTTDMVPELPFGVVKRDGAQPVWFRVMEIADAGGGTYTVKGRYFAQGKHAWVENNVPVPSIVFTEYDTSAVIPAPTDLNVSHQFEVDDVLGPIHNLTFSWKKAGSVGAMLSRFYAEVYTPIGQWEELYEGNSTSCQLRNVQPGRYVFSVKAINTFNKSSDVASIVYDLEYGATGDVLPPIFIGLN